MVRQKLKSITREAVASFYYASNHSLAHLQGKVTILMYHRVVSEKELNENYIQPGMHVRKDIFELQMNFLRENFHIFSFSDLLALWQEKKWDKSKRYCVITFDDGWLDNYIHAYPVLKKYDIPATIFLPTALISTNQWFWPEKFSYLLQHYSTNDVSLRQMNSLNSIFADYPWMKNVKGQLLCDEIDLQIERCKKLPDDEINDIIEKISINLNLKLPDKRLLLNWPEIEEMSQNGISFGSHSCNHKILTNLPHEEVQKELEDSKHVLMEKKVNHVPVLCYPNGSYNHEIAKQVMNAGYTAAVSTRSGCEGIIPDDQFALRRIGIHNDISSTAHLFIYRIIQSLNKNQK